MSDVYISVGNSDDKLTQAEWSTFVGLVDQAVTRTSEQRGVQVHGRWYSLPHERWQNACWCVEFAAEAVIAAETLRNVLSQLAGAFRQDSIAWAEADVVFLRPAGQEVDR